MPFFHSRKRAYAYARRWARTGRRPAFRRHRRSFRRHTRRKMWKTPYSDFRNTKFTYHYAKLIASGAGPTFALEQLRANSIYDPEYAVGGGQPAGYNEAARLWTYYDVRACKVTCKFINASANAVQNCFIFAQPLNESAGVVGTWALIENAYAALKTEKRAKMKTISPAAAAYGAGSECVLSMYASTQKVMRTIHDGAFQVAFGSNPSAVDAWLFNIVVAEVTNTVSPVSCYIDYTVTYYVRCCQRSVSNLT
jgi:hypothetical protein